METKIPIYIPDEDAKKFIAFQKHYDVFTLLDENDIFSIQYGKATLNFGAGILQTIVREEIVYKR